MPGSRATGGAQAHPADAWARFILHCTQHGARGLGLVAFPPCAARCPFVPLIALLCLSLAACAREAPRADQCRRGTAGDRGPEVQRAPQPVIDWSPVRLEAGDAWIAAARTTTRARPAGAGRWLATDLRKLMQDCRVTGLVRGVRYVGKGHRQLRRLGRAHRRRRRRPRHRQAHPRPGLVGGHVGRDPRRRRDRRERLDHLGARRLALLQRMRAAAGRRRHARGRAGRHPPHDPRAPPRPRAKEHRRRVAPGQHEDLRNYLERNGASVEVYDLMTTVPNRTLHLLDDAELARLGCPARTRWRTTSTASAWRASAAPISCAAATCSARLRGPVPAAGRRQRARCRRDQCLRARPARTLRFPLTRVARRPARWPSSMARCWRSPTSRSSRWTRSRRDRRRAGGGRTAGAALSQASACAVACAPSRCARCWPKR